MKKTAIVFIIVFCISKLSFAQNFYTGLKVGFKSEIMSPFPNRSIFIDDFVMRMTGISAPALQMVFRTTFSKNWEIEAGIGWYNYTQKLKVNIGNSTAFFAFGIREENASYAFSTPRECLYGSVFISPKAGYRFELSPNLHLRLNTGLQFGMQYNARSTSSTLAEHDPFELYVIYRGVQKPYLNLQISNAVSLLYSTKFNMYFSIFAACHAGLLRVYQTEIYLVNRKSREGNDFYDGQDYYMPFTPAIRGSYLEFGIELGYTWKKKQDKNIK